MFKERKQSVDGAVFWDGKSCMKTRSGVWKFCFQGCGCDGLSWEDSRFVLNILRFEYSDEDIHQMNAASLAQRSSLG